MNLRNTGIGLLTQLLHLVIYVHTEHNIDKHPNYNLLPKHCGVSYSDRIIGGTTAELGAYPWLVRIGYALPKCVRTFQYGCGAALISDQYVLTTAHCVTNLPTVECPSTLLNTTFVIGSILIGEYNSKTDPDCSDDVCATPVQHFKPSKVMVHENFISWNNANDIALIRINGKAKLNAWVSPICLPRGKQLSNYYVNRKATVAGWGITNSSTNSTSNVPMLVKLPILDINECIQSYSTKLSKEHRMCAGGEENKDSCGGDSGGPLMYVEAYNGPPRYYAIGLVSLGDEDCGLKGKPAIYTRVAGYMDWILDHMEA